MMLAAIVFIGSINAITAQLILVKTLEGFIHNEIVSYAAVLAPHFLALAIAAKRPAPQLLSTRQVILSALTLAGILVLLWSPAPLILQSLMGEMGSAIVDDRFLALTIPLAMGISYLLSHFHGVEIPWALQRKKHSVGQTLMASYIGALVGYVAVPFFLLPKLGLIQSVVLVTSLILLNSTLCALEERRESLLNSSLVGLFALVFSSLLIGKSHWLYFYEPQRRATIYADGLEDWPEDPFNTWKAAWKFIQEHIKVETIESPIQTIDWVRYENTNNSQFRLYLNGDFQFDSTTELQYHQGFLAPLKQDQYSAFKKILVIGAGDGLLAKLLFERMPAIEKIDLVDIDPMMVGFAREGFDLSYMNKNALKDPRIEVHIQDGFFFVHQCQAQYDLILIDLPYPSSFGLSRVYSREFYEGVKKCQRDESTFVILDAPITDRSGVVMTSTLHAAGFHDVLNYGRGNTYVIASDISLDEVKSHLESQNVASESPRLDKGAINQIHRPILPIFE